MCKYLQKYIIYNLSRQDYTSSSQKKIHIKSLKNHDHSLYQKIHKSEQEEENCNKSWIMIICIRPMTVTDTLTQNFKQSKN